jgi:hypothetical protein
MATDWAALGASATQQGWNNAERRAQNMSELAQRKQQFDAMQTIREQQMELNRDQFDLQKVQNMSQLALTKLNMRTAELKLNQETSLIEAQPILNDLMTTQDYGAENSFQDFMSKAKSNAVTRGLPDSVLTSAYANGQANYAKTLEGINRAQQTDRNNATLKSANELGVPIVYNNDGTINYEGTAQSAAQKKQENATAVAKINARSKEKEHLDELRKKAADIGVDPNNKSESELLAEISGKNQVKSVEKLGDLDKSLLAEGVDINGISPMDKISKLAELNGRYTPEQRKELNRIADAKVKAIAEGYSDVVAKLEAAELKIRSNNNRKTGSEPQPLTEEQLKIGNNVTMPDGQTVFVKFGQSATWPDGRKRIFTESGWKLLPSKDRPPKRT